MVENDRRGIDSADEAAGHDALIVSIRVASDLINRKIENDLNASFRDDHFPAIVRHSIKLPSQENRILGKPIMIDK